MQKKKNERLNESKLMNCGMVAKIINYNNSNHIDVQFLDGTIVYNRRYSDFKNGHIKNPKILYNGTSFIEFYIMQCLEQIGVYKPMHDEFIQKYPLFEKLEVDGFLDDLSVAIEYDGARWHKMRNDTKKNTICKKSNIFLIRIREFGLPKLRDCHCIMLKNDDPYTQINFIISEIIQTINNKFKTNFCISKLPNINRAREEYYNSYIRVGESNVMKCGKTATIINYRGCMDIDVKFEDEKIRKSVSYNNFKNGNISYPCNRVGMIKKMNCGKNAKIIDYNGCMDITVEFEDGTIVNNVQFYNFNKGQVAYPKNRLHEIRKMNCGMNAEIIKYKNCMDIDVRFKNNVIVQHVTYQHFKNGQISNKNKI